MTIVQDSAAKKLSLLGKYGEFPSSVNVEWVDSSTRRPSRRLRRQGHRLRQQPKKPPRRAHHLRGQSDALLLRVVGGHVRGQGMLKEEKKVKDPPTGQRGRDDLGEGVTRKGGLRLDPSTSMDPTRTSAIIDCS